MLLLPPPGALAIAGAKKYCQMQKWEGKTVAAVASGANMDFDRLRFVSERADSTETLVSARIHEKPGSFRRLYSAIFPRNVTEFSYRYNDQQTANVIISFQCMVGTSREQDKGEVISKIRAEGFDVSDLMDNEMAKAHARYLAGGRAPHVQHERLDRFEFPERPGALRSFLHDLGQGWNVTLFHYRGQGGDIGRVLVGLQVAPHEQEAFDIWLDNLTTLGYTHYAESDNPVYQQFLLR